MKRLLRAGIVFLLMFAVLVPAAAQDAPVILSVSSGEAAFAFPESLGPNVNIFRYAGDDPALEQPGGPQPPYVEFQMYEALDEPVQNLGWNAKGYVTVYNTVDFTAYPGYRGEMNHLQVLLSERPALDAYMRFENTGQSPTLPFAPTYPAVQVIRAQARYVETAAWKGISYLTVYRQDASPFRNNEFIYTLQAVSVDGSAYISARFPVVVPGIAAEIPADFNYDAWLAGIEQYMNDTIAALNAAPAESFSPTLGQLDEVISSIVAGAAG